MDFSRVSLLRTRAGQSAGPAERSESPEARAIAASDRGWMLEGRCRDYPVEMFFPTDGAGVIEAQQVCLTCGVRDVCLRYAVVHNIDHGVWGGASERQRRRIRRESSRPR